MAPYAVRALPGAPVAAPISWDGVGDPGLAARRWTVSSAEALLKENPWSPASRPRSLARADRTLRALEE
ncbi:non-homologous end-joining DNA ligase LigD [Streptacidiphilus rugosus]|uniref:non-homologous end-joining DNA ligase LigD n=1 Tax=Streptacidiphilus rugosus TaxID=405783 RepID=UPI00055C4121|nr:hypothetical protein [Streptacidiphilus rugosus]